MLFIRDSSKAAFSSCKKIYQTLLESYNKNLKKPSQNMIESEIQLFQQVLGEPEVGRYLQGIRRLRTISPQPLDLLERWVENSWGTLSRMDKMLCVNYLVESRRYSIFDRYSQEKRHEQIYFDELINKKYCECIVNGKIINDEAMDKILLLPGSGEWPRQFEFLSKRNSGLNIELLKVTKRRSPLEIQIESLLVTANYKFARQTKINSLEIDFYIPAANCAIEVLGPHHYTAENKLKGKDLMKLLVLNQWTNVALIHSYQLNTIKGIQKRLNYICQLIESATKRTKINSTFDQNSRY